MTDREPRESNAQASLPIDVLRERLPGLILRTFEAYEAHVDDAESKTATDRQLHHAAGKAAVQHLETLIKFWRALEQTSVAGPPDPRHGHGDMISRARQALAKGPKNGE